MEDEDIDMETVHDSQAFIHHHLNLLERPSTPGKTNTPTDYHSKNKTTIPKTWWHGHFPSLSLFR